MTAAPMMAGLIGGLMLLPSLPLSSVPLQSLTPAGANRFIETRLCASGRIIRIDLPDQEEPEHPTLMPCHAVCARDDDPVKRRKRVSN